MTIKKNITTKTIVIKIKQKKENNKLYMSSMF